MSVTALFRSKWGQKSQDTAQKHPTPVVQPSHDDDDDEEDDPKVGFSREPIQRNSRFYRSMRKKRLVSAQQSESKKTSVFTLYLHCTPNMGNMGLCLTSYLTLKVTSWS